MTEELKPERIWINPISLMDETHRDRARIFLEKNFGNDIEYALVRADVAEEHPEDYCKKCGRPNAVWFAPSPLWNKAVRAANEPEILCPVCFIQLAEIAGIKPHVWEVAPADYHAEQTRNSVTEAMKIINAALADVADQPEVADYNAAIEAAAARAFESAMEVAGSQNYSTLQKAACIAASVRALVTPLPMVTPQLHCSCCQREQDSTKEHDQESG